MDPSASIHEGGATRFASRILLFDRSGRILLFLDEFPDLPGLGKWITPGGGVDPGESTHEAAVRELFEETGLRVDELGDVVHSLEFAVQRASARHTFSHWDFFVHVVEEAFEPSREHWTAEEHLTVQDWRWWDPADLASIRDDLAPRSLPELAARFRPRG